MFDTTSYVGHDEPSNLFYSSAPGSGNQARYTVTLPTEPTAPPTSSTPLTYNFQLHPAFWFGMAMCADQSYPELVNTCIPDSDQNIADPAQTPYHAGEAFMEMQFYPPGWVPFQRPGGISCSATQWCAALNIDSLAENPVAGTELDNACVARVGSPEYVNFAFITKSGKAQAPANPVHATGATYTPDPVKDLFMNPGDKITVTMQDTADGLRIVIDDLTTGQSGFMTAGAANGFGQVKYATNPSTECVNKPYNFHPMYSTSSPQTRVTWAAHTYNVAMADEIGHFDLCSATDPSTLNCTGTEGRANNVEPTDSDDTFCWPGSSATLYHVTGCAGGNVPGFDGTSYLSDWPNGSSANPGPILFTSPLTGAGFNQNYQQNALETDLPRVEQGLAGCDPFHAKGCTYLPTTDDGARAQFYPYFSTTALNGCTWALGADIPGLTVNNFGKHTQWGSYDTGVDYTGAGGVPFAKADDFRQVFFSNACPATP